jgi:hypothetical protein
MYVTRIKVRSISSISLFLTYIFSGIQIFTLECIAFLRMLTLVMAANFNSKTHVEKTMLIVLAIQAAFFEIRIRKSIKN